MENRIFLALLAGSLIFAGAACENKSATSADAAVEQPTADTTKPADSEWLLHGLTSTETRFSPLANPL